ncbi:MAG: diguanylate phosphodiesterase [Rhodobacterales bacterium]|nr:MAG: diguanylate phosphodiesterase [Rhodobacterales bacterium]
MNHKERAKLKDIPVSHHDPLSYAVEARDRSVIQMVNDALRHRHVRLAFQPVVTAIDPGRVAFYEGLIRVMDPTGRIIPARDFINQVEETEAGRIIDCLSLEFGLKTLADQPDLRLSINMSARSIGYPRWMRTLKNGLKRDVTIAERLILEITESSAMTVPELVVNFMTELQMEGISFALDDFGAGHTSFRYFKNFFFDVLKIDGEFIRNIHADPDNQAITRAMVSIAKQFDMFTVAEFVESEADARYLASIGIDCLQGFYFGAPTIHPVWETSSEKRART